ncbi:hypothetical protein LA6_001677 [Marinibacterium anthonyi]|nr:hypothetical protein LA6_001677 [Marinibacterium anthonyi]
MTLRFARWLLALLILLVAGGLGAWLLLLHPHKQPATRDLAQVFNHGSIGNETAQGLPYWIWRVLPTVFPDHLPGAQRGYSAIGVYWEPGAPLPVGFSEKTLGVIPRVAPNCAFCHQGTYRTQADMPARLVSAGAGTRVDPQSYIRFLVDVGQDPRFTAKTMMAAITAIYDMPAWERGLYRFVLIPATRKALEGQAQRFAWMTTRPDWGPGRIDPFNPVKFENLGLPDDGTIGNSDMMPLWGLAVTDPTDTRRFALHWDGLLSDLHETVVAGAIGDGMSHSEWPGAQDALARMESFVRLQLPPPSPFSPDLPPGDPFHVDPDQVARGGAIYAAHCAECHDPAGPRFRTPIPIVEVATDRHRLDMWTVAARDRYLAYQDDYAWGFQHFHKTEGYLANELTGLWLRGPYLHNGSVPNLRALLSAPAERPDRFWRGSDLVDARNGGFVSLRDADPMRRMVPFDTQVDGNGNAGHLWGTDLPATDKEALLAYLKTL